MDENERSIPATGKEDSVVTIVRNPSVDYAELKVGDDTREYSRRLHSHPELSVGVIEEGGTDIWVRDESYRLSPGDMIYFPPEKVHLCDPKNASSLRFVMLYLKADWFRMRFAVDPCRIPQFRKRLTKRQFGMARNFFRSFPDAPAERFEADTVKFAQTLLIDSFRAVETPGTLEAAEGIRRVQARIQASLAEELSLDELSEIAHVNKYTLVRNFRKRFGITPHAYQLNLRIRRAKEFLRQDRTIADIAAECGFADQSHFDKTFGMYVGASPSGYRKSQART